MLARNNYDVNVMQIKLYINKITTIDAHYFFSIVSVVNFKIYYCVFQEKLNW